MNNKQHLLPSINCIADIAYFLEVVRAEGAEFHPMNDFSVYVYPGSHFRLYNDEEVIARNEVLDHCISVLTRMGYEPINFLVSTWKKQSKNQLCNKASANL